MVRVMFALDIVLAVVITSTTNDEYMPDTLPCRLSTLQTVATSWELMDKQEIYTIFNNPDRKAIDLYTVHKRYEQLIDTPPACDAIRLPDRCAINELISFNRRYRKNLASRLTLSSVPSYQSSYLQAISETDQLHRMWIAIQKIEYTTGIVNRRRLLKELRDNILGVEAYYSMSLPPVIPFYRLNTY